MALTRHVDGEKTLGVNDQQGYLTNSRLNLGSLSNGVYVLEVVEISSGGRVREKIVLR